MHTTHRRGARLGLVLAAVAVMLVSGTAPATARDVDRQPVLWFEDMEEVDRAFSRLARGDKGIHSKVRSWTEPGHAVSLWYAIFNAPENCSGPCDGDDFFIGGDPANGLNTTQIANARISMLYGGDGDVANRRGRVRLNGKLKENRPTNGPGQLVIGLDADGAMIPQAVTGAVTSGIEDARTAEVHHVLQDHGPAHADPDLRHQQLTMFEGACNPVCVDIQFAVHPPPGS